MMRLSTMWKVDGTIDADGSSPVARRILERWSHDRGSVRFFRSSANFLYVYRGEGERRFLRFADGSERSREATEAEIDLLGWLAARGSTSSARFHRGAVPAEFLLERHDEHARRGAHCLRRHQRHDRDTDDHPRVVDASHGDHRVTQRVRLRGDRSPSPDQRVHAARDSLDSDAERCPSG